MLFQHPIIRYLVF